MSAETKSRNLWPVGVIGFFIVFIAATVGLIAMAVSHKEELVNRNYYEQEIRFQSQIERLARTRQLGTQAAVTYDVAASRISVLLPADHVRRAAIGRIELYRASSAALDRQLKLAPDANGLQVLDATKLSPGPWKVRVSWTVANEDYLIDQKVVVGGKSS